MKTMPHWESPATEPIDLRVHLTSGSVRVIARPTEMITVDVGSGLAESDYGDDIRVEFADGHLDVVEPEHQGWLRRCQSLDIMITVPTGSRCSVRSTTADLVGTGELGSLDAKTGSGDSAADSIDGDLQVTSTSGKIKIDEVAGAIFAESASGAIELGQAGGEITIRTVTGRGQ